MKTHSVIVAAAALLISGGIASAQKLQYDSLGSPTPRPNQDASPNTIEPNVPIPGDGTNAGANDKSKAATSGASSTTGAGVGSKTPVGGAGAGAKTGGTTSDNLVPVTPGGITQD